MVAHLEDVEALFAVVKHLRDEAWDSFEQFLADMGVEYARHMLFEARQMAKAAHSEARSALLAKGEKDHA